MGKLTNSHLITLLENIINCFGETKFSLNNIDISYEIEDKVDNIQNRNDISNYFKIPEEITSNKSKNNIDILSSILNNILDIIRTKISEDSTTEQEISDTLKNEQH